MLLLKLDMFQSLFITVILIYLGKYLRNKFFILKKYCIPSAVVGGLIFSIFTCILYEMKILEIKFNIEVTNQLFYCIFFAASGTLVGLNLLKKGGKLVLIFTILAAILAALQNLLAVFLGKILGIKPLIALMTGSIPMTGGHDNAAAFAPIAESFGATGALEIAVAAATFGLISGCIIGGPTGNRLIQKFNLKYNTNESEDFNEKTVNKFFIDKEKAFNAFLLIFIATGIGAILFTLIKKYFPGVIFPIHVLCMLGGLLVRIISDMIKNENESLYEMINIYGEISLAIFVTMSIMTMKLWQLANLAIPIIILLSSQVILAYFFCSIITFRFLGKNYDAAIMAVGHTGFGLGAVPVSMATMSSVCNKYVYSKLAFFVVPVIGGLISNFTNVAIITFFLNIFK